MPDSGPAFNCCEGRAGLKPTAKKALARRHVWMVLVGVAVGVSVSVAVGVGVSVSVAVGVGVSVSVAV